MEYTIAVLDGAGVTRQILRTLGHFIITTPYVKAGMVEGIILSRTQMPIGAPMLDADTQKVIVNRPLVKTAYGLLKPFMDMGGHTSVLRKQLVTFEAHALTSLIQRFKDYESSIPAPSGQESGQNTMRNPLRLIDVLPSGLLPVLTDASAIPLALLTSAAMFRDWRNSQQFEEVMLPLVYITDVMANDAAFMGLLCFPPQKAKKEVSPTYTLTQRNVGAWRSIVGEVFKFGVVTLNTKESLPAFDYLIPDEDCGNAALTVYTDAENRMTDSDQVLEIATALFAYATATNGDKVEVPNLNSRTKMMLQAFTDLFALYDTPESGDRLLDLITAASQPVATIRTLSEFVAFVEARRNLLYIQTFATLAPLVALSQYMLKPYVSLDWVSHAGVNTEFLTEMFDTALVENFFKLPIPTAIADIIGPIQYYSEVIDSTDKITVLRKIGGDPGKLSEALEQVAALNRAIQSFMMNALLVDAYQKGAKYFNTAAAEFKSLSFNGAKLESVRFHGPMRLSGVVSDIDDFSKTVMLPTVLNATNSLAAANLYIDRPKDSVTIIPYAYHQIDYDSILARFRAPVMAATEGVISPEHIRTAGGPLVMVPRKFSPRYMPLPRTPLDSLGMYEELPYYVINDGTAIVSNGQITAAVETSQVLPGLDKNIKMDLVPFQVTMVRLSESGKEADLEATNIAEVLNTDPKTLSAYTIRPAVPVLNRFIMQGGKSKKPTVKGATITATPFFGMRFTHVGYIPSSETFPRFVFFRLTTRALADRPIRIRELAGVMGIVQEYRQTLMKVLSSGSNALTPLVSTGKLMLPATVTVYTPRLREVRESGVPLSAKK